MRSLAVRPALALANSNTGYFSFEEMKGFAPVPIESVRDLSSPNLCQRELQSLEQSYGLTWKTVFTHPNS